VLELFPETKSQGHWSKTTTKGFGNFGGGSSNYQGVGKKDKMGGSAARFFYCAKASKRERNAGLEGMKAKPVAWGNQAKAELKRGNLDFKSEGDATKHNKVEMRVNHHPTVKPVKLCEYLVRLVTPKDGVCLDPFMGSGTTAVACINTNRKFIGIELSPEYCEIANKRLEQETVTNLFSA
jgi:site-specific DNA-methyltransferase (adenine-specific)